MSLIFPVIMILFGVFRMTQLKKQEQNERKNGTDPEVIKKLTANMRMGNWITVIFGVLLLIYMLMNPVL